MPESPVSRQAASSLPPPIRDDDPGPSRVSAVDSPRPRRSIRVGDPRPGRVSAMDSRRPSTSDSVADPGSGRARATDSRRPASRPRPAIRVDDPVSEGAKSLRVSGSRKPSATANNELEEAENEIRRLNELRLGDDISYEEYAGYLRQLPEKHDVDTCTKLDAAQRKELNARHALYRAKYYHQLSQKVPDDNNHDDKMKGDRPSGGPEERRFSKCYEEDCELDWSFHPDYCKLAGLDDYQRIVPRNYGGYEYEGWDMYHKHCHSYEVEQEYIKYFEELSKKLKWIEAYLPYKPPSLKWGRILTRGTYQAIKIATDFSMITGGLAFSGFFEWLDSVSFDVCTCNELDGVYHEIWQRYTNEKKFRDALNEVYELNRFPLRQNRMRFALENETFCSDLEEEFLACTTCLKEFAEDKAQITEKKARELIAEALRKETQKPKFYEEYCRKKIDIARAIELLPS